LIHFYKRDHNQEVATEKRQVGLMPPSQVKVSTLTR